MKNNLIEDIYLYSALTWHDNGKFDKIALNSLIKYKEKFLLMFFLTKKAFIEIDIENIIWISWNEYDAEIIEIASNLCSIKWEFNLIQKIIFDILTKYFSFATFDEKIIIENPNNENNSKKLADFIFNDYKRYQSNFIFYKEFKKLYESYYKKYKEKKYENKCKI